MWRLFVENGNKTEHDDMRFDDMSFDQSSYTCYLGFSAILPRRTDDKWSKKVISAVNHDMFEFCLPLILLIPSRVPMRDVVY